jgi:N-acetylmuramate 1-kinase
MMLPNEANAIQIGPERSMKAGIIMAPHSEADRDPPRSHMAEADARLALIHEWLSRTLHRAVLRLEPASSDASFRRYFRAFCEDGSYVVMDAPPGKEDVGPYLKVSAMLESLGAHVPHVHAADTARGLLLLEDLGTTLYLERLNSGDDPERLYADALDALAAIQLRGRAHQDQLALYGRCELAREIALMPEWFLGRHLSLVLSQAEQGLLSQVFGFLIEEALGQPVVFVHRDYHARNLMVVPTRNPGIIDFQDALRGPVGYDLVSLLKDCYIAWPRERVIGWVSAHRARLLAAGGAANAVAGESEQQFLRWFDLVGVQRHIKVLGIFCRLWYRDGKAGYLPDLPRTLDYVRDACARYAELEPLADFLERRVVAQLPLANARIAAERAAAGASPAGASRPGGARAQP